MYTHAFRGIFKRELHRFLHQKARMISSLVRPLLWLIVFAAGFRTALGLAIIPPYESYISYPTYILPGLIGIILLFNGMQSSLSMVYDREMGSMKVLLTSPMPRSFLLVSKLFAGTLVSVIQVYLFLLIAWLLGVEFPLSGFLPLLPAVLLTGTMLGAIGLLLSSLIKQLENFAGTMNFVIFPMFFLSSALYPLWKMQESSEWIYRICIVNPFTYAVELIRFSLYTKLNIEALAVTTLTTFIVLSAAVCFFQKKGN